VVTVGVNPSGEEFQSASRGRGSSGCSRPLRLGRSSSWALTLRERTSRYRLKRHRWPSSAARPARSARTTIRSAGRCAAISERIPATLASPGGRCIADSSSGLGRAARCADNRTVENGGGTMLEPQALVGETGVLEDPSGTRVRWLRRAGRVVFVLFLGWLLAIVLGGLGLMPVAGIPLARAIRPSQGPPPLPKLPEPRKPSASDLRPAVPAAVFASRATNAARPARELRPRPRSATAGGGASHGKSRTAFGRAKATPASTAGRGQSKARAQTKTKPVAAASRGKSTTAPRQARTTPAASQTRRAVAPGQTKTTPVTAASRGKSTTAPGQTRTTPAASQTRSAVAPGQTKTTSRRRAGKP
jgi:hypothetical protein